jgi:acyl dehydratase
VDDLRFVYEDGLVAVPSMATILGHPGFWLGDPELGLDWPSALHGEQSVTLHVPLPSAGTVIARNTIDAVVDRGKGKGLFVHTSRTLHDHATDTQLATLRSLIILRGDGGTGGFGQPDTRTPEPVPDRSPDMALEKKSLPQAALIYRLSGDLNPLHADPAVATGAGFPGPVLHGLCTMGMATREIMRACCGDDPAQIGSISVRFAAPVFPGETIRTEIWREADEVRFRSLVVERDTVVLDRCTATLRN